MAGFFSLANGKKTWYYLKKNGIKSACLAVLERLEERKKPSYVFSAPTEEVLDRQRAEALACSKPVRFSLLVPAYETKKEHLTALLDSVRVQSWPYWELVIADAGRSSQVYETLAEWTKAYGVPLYMEAADQPAGDEEAAGIVADCRQTDNAAAGVFAAGTIRYRKLSKNGGISENTNAALGYACGDYTGLLDHDDLLTADALYEMAAAIDREHKNGREVLALYSDEDKCDGSGEIFYEPHRKTDFDPELLLTNNYICHFLVMKTGWLQQLKLRSAYDGAQDFDLVLRAYGAGIHFLHVDKVLYHWRCHMDSTAQNPRSKAYAYEAGRRAVEDFCHQKGWQVSVSDTKHLGFYRVEYADLWRDRPEIGAVAYPVYRKGRLVSGIFESDGQLRYEGLKAGFSGPVHRAVLQQQALVADVQQLKLRPQTDNKLQTGTTEEPMELSLTKAHARAIAACREKGTFAASREFCEQLRAAGLRILWDPKGK